VITPSEILANIYCIKSTFTIGLQYCSAHEVTPLLQLAYFMCCTAIVVVASFPGSLVTPHPLGHGSSLEITWKELYYGLVKIRYKRNAFNANDPLRNRDEDDDLSRQRLG